VWPNAEELVRALDAAIETVRELRGRMGRKPKKPKLTSRRPAKSGPSKGCGTGAGGFKAGNQCAKESGGPGVPKKVRIVSKKGTVPLPFKAKEFQKQELAKTAAKKARLKKKKIAEKGEKGRKTVGKLKKILSKTAGKTKEKLAKQREKAAKVAKKKQKGAKGREILAKFKAKGEAAKKSLAEKKRLKEEKEKEAQRIREEQETQARFDAKRKELDAVQRIPGEAEFDYHMRANKKDFDELRDKIEAVDSRVKDARDKIDSLRREGSELSNRRRIASKALTDADKKAGGSGLFFYNPDGSIKSGAGAKLKAGSKEYDELESSMKSESAKQVEIEEAEDLFARLHQSRNDDIHGIIGSLRLDKGIDVKKSTPISIKDADLDLLNAQHSGASQNKQFSEADGEIARAMDSAMAFYSRVTGGRFSGLLSSIKVVKIPANKTQHASRPGGIQIDYDLDDLSKVSEKMSFIRPTWQNGSLVGHTKERIDRAPFIALRGYRSGTKEASEGIERSNQVAIHEIAHPLGQSRKANELLNGLWKKRYEEHGSPELKRYSSEQSRDHQRTFDDRWFGDRYSGVTYPRATAATGPRQKTYVKDNIGNFGDTELFTMGMQHIYSSPLEFMRHDPEHFFATVGIISGRFVR
jgi:hypothetical protein